MSDEEFQAKVQRIAREVLEVELDAEGAAVAGEDSWVNARDVRGLIERVAEHIAARVARETM